MEEEEVGLGGVRGDPTVAVRGRRRAGGRCRESCPPVGFGGGRRCQELTKMPLWAFSVMTGILLPAPPKVQT